MTSLMFSVQKSGSENGDIYTDWAPFDRQLEQAWLMFLW